MEIRRATRDDLAAAASLLRAAGRPPLPSGLPLANVLVALEEGAVVGVIALEVHGLRGVVWPDAVDAARAGDEVRASLLRTLVSRAHELSLRELYLVADGQAQVYRETGFAPVADDAVPVEIQRARAFRDPRPDGARALRLPLASRPV